MAEEEKSVAWIVVAAAILVVVFGWGFLAGSYAGAHSPSIGEMSEEERESLETRAPARARRGALAAFIGNSIEQLPNLPAVVSWHFSNRIWLPILIMLAFGGVISGGFVLKRVEQNLNQPRHQRRR